MFRYRQLSARSRLCPLDRQTEKRDSSLHRTDFHCSRLQCQHALRHSIWRLALYRVMWGFHVAAQPCKLFQLISCCTVFVQILTSGSLEIFSYEINSTSVTSMHHAPQHASLWLYVVFRFMAAAVPKRFNFSIIPLTVVHGIASRKDILWTNILQRWHAITINPFFFTNVCANCRLHG